MWTIPQFVGMSIEYVGSSTVYSGDDWNWTPLHGAAMGEKGKTTVIEGRREFSKVGEGQLDEGFMASPAVVGESFVLRTRTHV
jgi:hypothetical protein